MKRYVSLNSVLTLTLLMRLDVTQALSMRTIMMQMDVTKFLCNNILMSKVSNCTEPGDDCSLDVKTWSSENNGVVSTIMDLLINFMLNTVMSLVKHSMIPGFWNGADIKMSSQNTETASRAEVGGGAKALIDWVERTICNYRVNKPL